ncbi:MAG: hypothetical protein R3B89_28425 [Polyangiaceae bacterium]
MVFAEGGYVVWGIDKTTGDPTVVLGMPDWPSQAEIWGVQGDAAYVLNPTTMSVRRLSLSTYAWLDPSWVPLTSPFTNKVVGYASMKLSGNRLFAAWRDDFNGSTATDTGYALLDATDLSILKTGILVTDSGPVDEVVATSDGYFGFRAPNLEVFSSAGDHVGSFGTGETLLQEIGAGTHFGVLLRHAGDCKTYYQEVNPADVQPVGAGVEMQPTHPSSGATLSLGAFAPGVGVVGISVLPDDPNAFSPNNFYVPYVIASGVITYLPAAGTLGGSAANDTFWTEYDMTGLSDGRVAKVSPGVSFAAEVAFCSFGSSVTCGPAYAGPVVYNNGPELALAADPATGMTYVVYSRDGALGAVTTELVAFSPGSVPAVGPVALFSAASTDKFTNYQLRVVAGQLALVARLKRNSTYTVALQRIALADGAPIDSYPVVLVNQNLGSSTSNQAVVSVDGGKLSVSWYASTAGSGTSVTTDLSTSPRSSARIFVEREFV